MYRRREGFRSRGIREGLGVGKDFVSLLGKIKYRTRHESETLNTAWESEEMITQPILLTFATTDQFCDNTPTTRIDTIVSKVNDIDDENTDIEWRL
jgi:hypothetical protein